MEVGVYSFAGLMLRCDGGSIICRWYHERMLSCCQDLSVVEKEGITLPTYACTQHLWFE
jgi:hypothetical protein